MLVKIDQAFLSAYTVAAFGLAIASENLDFTPTAGTEYVELLNIPNNITALSVEGTDETDGLFRIILRWPLNKGSIQAKLKADEIMAVFKIGTIVTYSGQSATVTNISRANGYAEEGWYKTVITIGYKAFINR